MKATLPDGTVLDGTIEEVTEAIRSLGGAHVTNGHSETGYSATRSETTVWTPKRAAALWNWLYGDQQKLVKFLLDRGGSASQVEIMKHLGLKKGNELAGVRSCITRNARRETGYSHADVVKWAVDGQGNWGYKLVPEVHDLLRQVAKSQGG
jgi:hypothetical protein